MSVIANKAAFSKRMSRSIVASIKRNIAIGTDITTSKNTFQKARPWDMENNDANLEANNIVSMKDLFADKRVAVFGVPAPFTGTCTNEHYPAYKAMQDDFLQVVDEVVCYSVADPYAHYHWGKAMDNDFSKISFLADTDCDFAKEYDLDRDYTGASLGHRSARFSMVVDNGLVTSFNMVEDAAKDAETLLEQAKH
mmetsp:Transcript_27203/g.41154  ORF Transcript_27203/g.41154 Transcript_27203/m.41154 type:complete len:195 (-) Transcript_27203:268-852(-)